MTSARRSVLVLGAYSFIGECILADLLDQTECAVVATGRNEAKVAATLERLRHPRLSACVLDALDWEALGRACRSADIVINCVGPYIINGYDIASKVVESGAHYVDYAFEQFHYRRLEKLNDGAVRNRVAVVTGAGAVGGLSALLSAFAAERLQGLDRVSVYHVEGRMHSSEHGFASFVNGALEPALGNQDFIDGRYVPARMGTDAIVRMYPEPHGATNMLSDPSIDSLVLPRQLPVRTIRNYFGLGMKVPFGFFAVMRLLNPYKNRLFYTLTARVVRRVMRQAYESQASGKTPAREPLLTVEAESGERRMTVEVGSRNHFNSTAILPVLICKRLAEGAPVAHGVQTALDSIRPDVLLRELDRQRELQRLSWSVSGP